MKPSGVPSMCSKGVSDVTAERGVRGLSPAARVVVGDAGGASASASVAL